MNKKRFFLTVLALVLVCALSIMGTVAYLTHTTDTVTNTFVAAGGGQLIDPEGGDDDPDTEGALKLQEHEAVKIMANEIWTGKYDLSETVIPYEDAQGNNVTGNQYDVMPGMVIPKDPFITITGKTEVPAYLYVEIANELDADVYAWSVTNNWEKLEGVTGKNGGSVYVYTADAAADGINPVIVTTNLSNLGILADNKITVADAEDLKLSEAEADPTSMVFYAYLAQAAIGENTDPASIFNTCFGTTPITPAPGDGE